MKRKHGAKKEGTVCFLVDGDKVLLALKKRGHGEGYWNGVGGKLLPGESPKQAAIRETNEEIGVELLKLTKVGELTYGDAFFVHVFIAIKWKGEPIETEEMNPKWFAKSKVPYNKMWDKDYVG